MRRVAQIKCPYCGKDVIALRDKKGRILITTTSALVLGGFGGFIGGSIGIATGGWGIAATVPLGIIGMIVGGGLGYIVSDKTIDKPTCPKCKNKIELW